MAAKKKRGYSRAFPFDPDTRKRYMLDDIPAGFWVTVRAKAKRDGYSLRGLILLLLQQWIDGEIVLPEPAVKEAANGL